VIRPEQKDRQRFLDFVDREFGKIWHFEAAKAFEAELPTAFFAEHDGDIVGFSVHDVNNRGLGFFGPMGVTPSERKHGYGRQLLLASLTDLRRAGYSSAVIPWIDSIDFYRRSANAQPSERFMVLVRA
jgi:GNAT superfamily N-acetyltransferase